jgi:hypothetical protein
MCNRGDGESRPLAVESKLTRTNDVTMESAASCGHHASHRGNCQHQACRLVGLKKLLPRDSRRWSTGHGGAGCSHEVAKDGLAANGTARGWARG